jgi:hypothetical protein
MKKLGFNPMTVDMFDQAVGTPHDTYLSLEEFGATMRNDSNRNYRSV